MDPYTISLVQKMISRILERCKTHAIYGVDSWDELQYIRGQIRSLEDLQQEIKDLLSKTENIDEQVHGDTETDWSTLRQEVETVLDPKAIKQSTLDKLPSPTGYRLLVLPYGGPKKTKGGVYLADSTQETIQMTTVCGLVLKMGDLCYFDKEKFPKGPWCKLNDWIIFSRYAGSRFKIDGGEVRVLNDDEVISTISDPSDILHHY